MRGRLFHQAGQYLDLILERGSSKDGFLKRDFGICCLVLHMLRRLFCGIELNLIRGTDVFP